MVSKIWGDLVVNVKSFGAKGNWVVATGKGADDTAAFQDAIDYALSKGKSDIWMPPGSYKYTTLLNTSGITFYGDNVTLHGTTVLNVTNFNDIRTRIENIIAGAGSDTEIVDARLPETGDAFATLKARLDAEHHALVDADSAMKAEYTDAIAALQTAYTVADNARSSRIDNLIINASGNVGEVVDARMPAAGSPFTTLRSRLNATDAQLADTAKKLGSWIDVTEKPFNAKGDGVTDDTTAIQAALTYVGTLGGGIVFAPKGTYIISDTLTIPANTYFYGAGMDATIINWKVPSAVVKEMIRFSTNSNTTYSRISDLSLNGSRAERSLLDDQVSAGIIPRDNITIERVRIHNTPGPGITSSDINNIVIDSCRIYDTGHHNVYFSSHDHGYVKNVRISNNFLGASAVIPGRLINANIIKLRHDLAGDLIENVLISNNDLEPCSEGSIMIYVSTEPGASTCRITQVSIVNNRINLAQSTSVTIDTCIYMGNNSRATNVLIADNYIGGSGHAGKYGMRLLFSDLTNTRNVTVRENAFFNSAIAMDTRKTTISDNYISFTEKGVTINSSGSVTRNRFESSTDNAIAIDQVTGDCMQNEITLTGLTTTGILLATSTNLVFERNKITGATTAGISRNGKVITGCIFDENIFASCTANYLNFTNSTATMKNNTFEPSSKVRSGATADRPTPVYVGEPYFDSTIRRPVFYNGANYFGDAMAAAPTTGVWQLNEIVWNSAPASGGFIGWVCTSAGSPGTWKTFGLIS